VFVKICGVRSVAQALHAQACGAQAVGLNLYAPSPRSIPPALAAEIADAVDIESWIVVVKPSAEQLGEWVGEIQPTVVQVHGAPVPWIGVDTVRAFKGHPGVLDEIDASRFLLDANVPGAHGGTGVQVDVALARRAAQLGQLILAGGLRPDNVADAISAVQPWGVDVASGVESAPGIQDPDRVAAFVHAAHGASPS
jgi:phosphoribosylanthranilate isomerase